MGTSGLLGLIIKGKRHAAYNHFDSYPAGLGQDIVAFILGLTDEEIENMAARVAEITWVSRDSPPTKEQQEYYNSLNFANLRVSEQRLDDWYCLPHKMQGAAALPQILNGKLKHLEEGGMDPCPSLHPIVLFFLFTFPSLSYSYCFLSCSEFRSFLSANATTGFDSWFL
ncbi:hypothetical protein DL98DRAFT_509877, partial [Cadophora sp. DSE1049]